MQDVDKFKEACGVFGIFSKDKIDAAFLTYYGLYSLQHRGQESAGIVISNGDKLCCYKKMGLAAEVFNEEILSNMQGSSAIGHVRYSTTGASNILNAQPILCNCDYGEISIAHNGNLINSSTIRKNLKVQGIKLNTDTDSEVILRLIAKEHKGSLENAVIDALKYVKGSYSLVLLTKDKLIGVRDPNGIKPLCIGKLDNSYIICSESCALNSLGASFIRDVKPGEMVIVDKKGIENINFSEHINYNICAFEYIYFAREDSVIDEISVYKSRFFSGIELYKEAPVKADMVIAVPDSGIPAAMGYAEASGIPYNIGFVKNRYVGRTFIAPSQNLREKNVSIKLMPIRENVEGKRIVVVDDSIVRGTTSKKLIKALKEYGAKEIHFRVASPMIKNCCYFGIDTYNRHELIGNCINLDEIRTKLQVDSIAYLSLKGLNKVLGNNKKFCFGCFNGKYPYFAE